MASPAPLEYDPPFVRNVGGRAYARFQLDPRGEPIFKADRDGLRHYPIRLFLDSPRRAEIDEVSYTLQEPDYPDETHTSTDRANDFRAELWSYGDFPIVVRVKIGDDVFEQSVWLSNMLDAGYAGEARPSPVLKDALFRVRIN